MKLSSIFRASAIVLLLTTSGLAIQSKAIADSPAVEQAKIKTPADWVMKGLSFVVNSQYKESITAYDEAIKLDPNYSDAYVQRAMSHISLEDWKAAIADCEKVIFLGDKEDLKTIYGTRAMAYDGMKNFKMAIADFDRHLSTNPENAISYYGRGKAYEGMGDQGRAMQDFEKSKALATAQNDGTTLLLLESHGFLKTLK